MSGGLVVCRIETRGRRERLVNSRADCGNAQVFEEARGTLLKLTKNRQ